ncbi:MAG: inositol monophosphatase [Propionibacteriaceae bacterium]|jgi:fructose-1,6-bisphosphatase/inositol monophosphatase family enzyme|nr:inositol monophosphatase [Propionibacteriaceae bacterium]
MDSADILCLMKQVADDLIRPRFQRLEPDQIKQKEPGDYVTVADQEAEAWLTEQLRRRHPDAAIVGEEAVAAQPALLEGIAGHAHAFVIDPIDGTRNYIQGDPNYAVMIGELRHGQATRGWIWQPEFGVALVGELGAGVERNGVRLAALERTGPPRGTATISRLIGSRHPSLADPIRSSWWCAGVDYPMLFDGRIDFCCFKPPKPWDHVPGALMARELGGVVRISRGPEYQADVSRGELVVAADARVFQTVEEVMAASGAPTG